MKYLIVIIAVTLYDYYKSIKMKKINLENGFWTTLLCMIVILVGYAILTATLLN